MHVLPRLPVLLVGAALLLLIAAIPYAVQKSRISPQPGIGIGGGPPESISDANLILGATNTMSFVGRRVMLRDIPVREIIRPGIFFAGTAYDKQLLIIIGAGPQVGPGKLVTPGQHVDIAGPLRVLPAEGDMRLHWQLTQEEADAIRGENIYLDADTVQLK